MAPDHGARPTGAEPTSAGQRGHSAVLLWSQTLLGKFADESEAVLADTPLSASYGADLSHATTHERFQMTFQIVSGNRGELVGS